MVSKCGGCSSRATTLISIFLKPAVFQPAVQIAFGKTRPAVAVKLVRLLEVVLGQVEDHDLPAAA